MPVPPKQEPDCTEDGKRRFSRDDGEVEGERVCAGVSGIPSVSGGVYKLYPARNVPPDEVKVSFITLSF